MSELTFCERTTFDTLCNALEKIQTADNRHVKADIMKQLISSFREQSKVTIVFKFTCNEQTQNTFLLEFTFLQNDSFYPILRLILPEQDNERGPYGVKEHNLAKTYIRILCLSKTSKDAQKLQNYK